MPNQLHVPVEGTIVDWEREIQINPATEQCFDFHGHLLHDTFELDNKPIESTKKKGGRHGGSTL